MPNTCFLLLLIFLVGCHSSNQSRIDGEVISGTGGLKMSTSNTSGGMHSDSSLTTGGEGGGQVSHTGGIQADARTNGMDSQVIGPLEVGRFDSYEIGSDGNDPVSSSYVFVGTGNMGDGVNVPGAEGTKATGLLLKAVMDENPEAIIFAAGDNAYNNGNAADYSASWGVSHWGDYKSKVRAVMGDHDYRGGGYPWTYFSHSGTQAKPYYSFDIGAWHIVMLDTNISTAAGSAQEVWLKSDLSASNKRCTMAIFHHPLRNANGTNNGIKPLWDALYAAGADVVYSAHIHAYQRLAPSKPDGSADPIFGIRTFVAGNGGTTFETLKAALNITEVQNAGTWGIVKFVLSNHGYTWEFIPVAGKTFKDSGSGTCHDAP